MRCQLDRIEPLLSKLALLMVRPLAVPQLPPQLALMTQVPQELANLPVIPTIKTVDEINAELTTFMLDKHAPVVLGAHNE